MRIWGETPKVTGISEKHKNVGKIDSVSGIKGKKDVVSISGHAKDYQTVLKALKNTPDIRTDRVEKLAQSYESGNYDVNGKDVADKIINSVIDRKV